MKLLQKLKSLISIATLTYVAGLSIWFLLWLTVKDGQWMLVLINRFVWYLFYPAPILLLLNLSFRLWKPAASLLFPILLFFSLYSPYVIPKPARSQPATLSVLTYNVLFGNENYQNVADVILNQGPDLVALQEIQPEMMAELQILLADEYQYSLMGTEHEWGTTAVFSRYPFTSDTDAFVLDLENDRPAVVVRTNIDGEPITFISAHLNAYSLQWHPYQDRPEIINLRTKTQNRQAEILLELIRQEQGTVILGCDCNSLETSESMRMLSQVLRNGSREVGWRPFSSTKAGAEPDDGLRRIDYVMQRGELKAVGAYLLNDSGGSDHRPVLVELRKK